MKVQVSNLNNSIRFYNLLLGRRPEHIGFDRATYLMGEVSLVIEERPEHVPTASPRYYLAVEDLKTAFKRLNTTINSSSSTDCEVLEHSFQVADPDGFQWVISEGDYKPDDKPMTDCYLEPINF